MVRESILGKHIEFHSKVTFWLPKAEVCLERKIPTGTSYFETTFFSHCVLRYWNNIWTWISEESNLHLDPYYPILVVNWVADAHTRHPRPRLVRSAKQNLSNILNRTKIVVVCSATFAFTRVMKLARSCWNRALGCGVWDIMDYCKFTPEMSRKAIWKSCPELDDWNTPDFPHILCKVKSFSLIWLCFKGVNLRWMVRDCTSCVSFSFSCGILTTWL